MQQCWCYAELISQQMCSNLGTYHRIMLLYGSYDSLSYSNCCLSMHYQGWEVGRFKNQVCSNLAITGTSPTSITTLVSSITRRSKLLRATLFYYCIDSTEIARYIRQSSCWFYPDKCDAIITGPKHSGHLCRFNCEEHCRQRIRKSPPNNLVGSRFCVYCS